jgi:hypothetical protein
VAHAESIETDRAITKCTPARRRLALVSVVDAHYENPRLAALYDPLDSDRSDLEVYKAWSDVTDVGGEFVSWSTTYVFESDGAVLTADSTLRFRRGAAASRSR